MENISKTELRNYFPTNFGDRIQQVSAIPEFSEGKELETVLIVVTTLPSKRKYENEIKEKNKNITESINYAERIQSTTSDTKLVQEFYPIHLFFIYPATLLVETSWFL